MQTIAPEKLEDYRWLTSEQAAVVLAEVSASGLPMHQSAARLRRSLSAARTHLVLELCELRRRARDKFADAERMFFTARGLEQATDQWIAAYKALRFGRGKNVDLCCGVGGDLMALAGRSSEGVLGVERDACCALLAEANANALGCNATLLVDDVAKVDLRQCDAWHLDPDRRPRGRRTSQPEVSEPPTDAISKMLQVNGAAALKLAPAAEVPESWARQAEREWISRDRQCRQQVAWFGALSREPGQVRATVVFADGRPPCSVHGIPGTVPRVASQLGRYLLEPEAAVLAAGLTGHVAHRLGVQAIARDIPYLTGDTAVADAHLSCFEIQEVLPLDLRRVRAALTERRIGRLEVKKRGVDHKPEEILRRLRPAGEESATLILTRAGGGAIAILAKRTRS